MRRLKEGFYHCKDKKAICYPEGKHCYCYDKKNKTYINICTKLVRNS